jgi:phosphoglycerate dehydrogenase-like enzyme
MPTRPLTIFCTSHFAAPLVEELQRETAAHNLLIDDGTSPDWNDVDVAFGQPAVEAIIQAPRLRWVHITSAGYTRYDNSAVREAFQNRPAQLTNSSHVYGEPCAQHLLAMMLAFSRQLLPLHEAQLNARDWQTSRRRAESFLLGGQSVVMLGFGAIAQRLVQMLQPFDMKVVAIKRQVQPFPGVQVVGEEDAEKVLAMADHVVNTLPDNTGTQGWMNAKRFAAMKPGAFFYNIGRGTTVQQEALMEVLNNGQVRAAYLDVTDPEPLPPEHRLWTTPNCYITPHSGGGHAGEDRRLIQHFVRNLRRFERDEELLDRVF